MAYAFGIGDEFPDPPTRAEVEADIADWKSRLDALVQTICSWAQEYPFVECEIGTVSKIERKMQMVGITVPADLPAVLVRRLVTQSVRPQPSAERTEPMKQRGLPGRVFHNEASVSITPDARWVVGTRGQVWIRSNKVFDTIADIGSQRQPDWRLIRRSDPEHLIPFTKEVLQEFLEELR